jgi:hypothetical protein
MRENSTTLPNKPGLDFAGVAHFTQSNTTCLALLRVFVQAIPSLPKLFSGEKVLCM